MTQEWRNALPIGTVVDGCCVERVLGAGGFGTTYLATDVALDRKAAVKEYLPVALAERAPDGITVRTINSAHEDDFRFGLERFQAEAQTLAKFTHPNIIGVQKFFEANGTAYIVMPYEEGLSLAEILAEHGALTEAELREVLAPLLDGLEKVHEAGFLHRDIKPGNIYIRKGDGSPVLLDFGAARQALGERSQSLTTIVTPGYAPFEQYSARGTQGPWTDIYALGATLYQAVTGTMPPDAVARMHGEDLVPAAQAAMGPYDPAFLAAIDAALALQGEDRPQSIAAWRAMLDGAAAAISDGAKVISPATRHTTLQAGQAAPVPEPPGTSRRLEPNGPRRWRKIGRAVAAVLLIAVAAGGIFGYREYLAVQQEKGLAAEAESRHKAVQAKRRAAEEARKRAAAEAARQAEAARRKAAEEEQRRAAEEAKRKAAEEARRKAAEEARKKAANARAKRGKIAIQLIRAKESLLRRARAAIKRGSFYEAKGYIDQAEEIDPNSDAIRKLRNELDNASAEADAKRRKRAEEQRRADEAKRRAERGRESKRVATRECTDDKGRVCREFRESIMLANGKRETISGLRCRKSDGSWEFTGKIPILRNCRVVLRNNQ